MLEPVRKNQDLYDRLWARLPIPSHESWPIWRELSHELTPASGQADRPAQAGEPGETGAPRLLELGSGVLPKIPVRGGYFADLSQSALRKLRGHGGLGVRSAGALPFQSGAFRVVCAFEVLEHIPDDETTIAEIARVLSPGGALYFSVPVDPGLFTGFDTACGHVRRYDAPALEQLLKSHGLVVERWTTQPNRFRRRGVGDFAGWLIALLERFPRLMIRLKRHAMAAEQRLRYVWQRGDIGRSHEDGGLIAVARKL